MHEQWVNGAWQLLAFFNWQLCSIKRKYSTLDRELLVFYLAIPHGSRCLWKPLTFILAKVTEPWSALHSCPTYWSLQQTFNMFNKKHCHRLPLLNHHRGCPQGLDYAHMAADQASRKIGGTELPPAWSASVLRYTTTPKHPWHSSQCPQGILNARVFTQVPTSNYGLPQSHVPTGLQAFFNLMRLA